MIIYIVSPYRAKDIVQFEMQLDHTKEISKEVVVAGHEVIVPHLYYPTFLDDSDEDEREIGTESAIRLLHVCDTLFVFIGLGVSSGMEAEIEAAKQKDMEIRYFKNINELRDILKRETSQNRATNAKAPYSKTQGKCEDCLHNKTAENIPFPMECGECSLFYPNNFEKR